MAILYSGQLPTTAATKVYVVPPRTLAEIQQGTICNTSAGAVTVNLAFLRVGDTDGGTHTVISAYSLAAGDTLALRDYLVGARLEAGEAISVTAGSANVIDVVLTGSVSAV